MFEIGRRLKHVKENDLVHGEFGKWLEKVNLNKSQASKFITIIQKQQEKISMSKKSMNILYEIATLPEPEHAKGHSLSNDEPIII
ncbi:DUF3102 domain-containing protein [Staphylococcus warneri]|uniref:DUF3102 domain-containing protein n=1 Tax=Staphylococcus warneri TaxID=1292 RepID=UPI003EE49C04